MMQLYVLDTPEQLGQTAAAEIARGLREAITARGEARLVLSTGASQLTTVEALVREDVDWSRVIMFHLDEYIGLPETHPASFRKYLRERFAAKVPALKAAYYVQGEGDIVRHLAELEALIREAPVDVGVIGIGENAHIAFNDPPADFDNPYAYAVVTLDAKCRRQQAGEGWFATPDDVPAQAISMTVSQIMRCRKIVSCVPYAVKADAIHNTLTAPAVTNMIPATMLRTHPDWSLYLDDASAARIEVAAYQA